MRRLWLLACLLPLQALAGAQQYEPIADSVRTRLSGLVADKAVPSMAFRSTSDAQRWLGEMDIRLARRIPDRKQRLELLRTVHYEATRVGLDPQLVLGAIEVESGFRQYAAMLRALDIPYLALNPGASYRGPRTEVTKKIWAYIKRNGLQDKKNRRMINADDNLKPVFGGKSSVSMFDMTKLVSRHLK